MSSRERSKLGHIDRLKIAAVSLLAGGTALTSVSTAAAEAVQPKQKVTQKVPKQLGSVMVKGLAVGDKITEVPVVDPDTNPNQSTPFKAAGLKPNHAQDLCLVYSPEFNNLLNSAGTTMKMLAFYLQPIT